MGHKEEYIMEKKSIRMIAAVAAAAMLVPLAACGGGNAADGKTTLSFFSNNSQDKYQPIIDAFEKANPTSRSTTAPPPVPRVATSRRCRLESPAETWPTSTSARRR